MSFWSTTEADIQRIVLTLKADALSAAKTADTVIKWVAANAQTIDSDLLTALGFAQQAGIVTSAEVQAAMVAVAGLQAIQAAQAAGSSDAATLAKAAVAGYAAYKGAQGAVASATAAAVSAPTATAAPAAPVAPVVPAAPAAPVTAPMVSAPHAP